MKEKEIKELELLREKAKGCKLGKLQARRLKTLKIQEDLEKAKKDEKEIYDKATDLFWIKNLKKLFTGEELLEVLEDEVNIEVVVKACKNAVEEIKVKNNIVDEVVEVVNKSAEIVEEAKNE